MKKTGAILLACGLAALLPQGPAMAEDANPGKHAGDLMLRLRSIGVLPATSSKVGTIGGQVQASNTVDPEIDLTYFFTDNIAVEGIGAVTRHHLTAAGTSIGNVDIGKVSLLPPTVTLQYHPLPQAAFSPYVGAGIN